MRIAGAMRVILCVLVVMTMAEAGAFVNSANAQDRSQTRSMVISRGGIVAAESPLAAQAGAQILERVLFLVVVFFQFFKLPYGARFDVDEFFNNAVGVHARGNAAQCYWHFSPP